MGIIKRQGFYYTLISYTGVIIGSINTIFLYIHIFRPDQIGEFNNLQDVGLIFTQLAQIGLPSIVAKYFPKFRTEDKTHQGLISWVIILGFCSFFIITILFLYLKPAITLSFYKKSPYFQNIFYLIIPYSFFLLSNAILDVFSRVIYKGLLFSFMNEVVVRLGTSLGLILYFYKWINFFDFILIFIVLNGSITLALIIQLFKSGEFKVKFNVYFFKENTADLVKYGFYTLLAGSTFLWVQKADKMILTNLDGDAVQGVYSIFLYIITVVRIPSIGIGRVSYQLVSDFWQNNNMAKIDEIYKKTSLVQMIIGLFLFLGIILNRNFLVFLLKKPIYQEQFNLIYFLGLAVLVDTTGGLNSYILAISHKFRISTGILIISLLLCIGFNYLLIPILGPIGAAISLFITYFFLNFFNTLYLKIRFQIQPFSLEHLKVLGLSLFSFISVFFIPSLKNPYFDLLLRGSLFSFLFIGSILIFKVSEDINLQFHQIISRSQNVFKKD